MALFKTAASSSSTQEIEHLIKLLLEGEKLAARVSKAQASYFKSSHPQLGSFFRKQSRQESFHAKLFKSTLLWLNPKSALSDTSCAGFDRIESHLLDTLEQGNAHNSVLGLQVMIESLGESALRDLDSSLDAYGAGLRRVRALVLAQEASHHAFGHHYFCRQASACKIHLHDTAELVRGNIHGILADVAPQLEFIGVCGSDYMTELDADMYSALNTETVQYAS